MNKNKKETQEKYFELEMLKKRAENIQKQIMNINSKVLELTESINALDNLKGYEKGTEILVPLGANSFAKAKLLGVDKLMMDVGSGTMIEKKLEESKDTIEEQIKVLENVGRKLENSLRGLRPKIEKLQIELSKLPK